MWENPAYQQLKAPTSAADKKLVDALMSVYGARDIFMGLDIYSAVCFRDRKSMGWILIAASGVAFWDGAVCRTQVGKGEWNHWGYAPKLTTVGTMLRGVFDRTR
jgi:hypothetical protein